MLAVIAERRLPPAPVERVAVFEEDGMQPVSRACRQAVRLAAGALGESGLELVDDRPPRAADLREAFNTIVGSEVASAFGLVAGREAELMPYTAEMAEALRGFDPSFSAYAAAFEQIAEIDALATRWFGRRRSRSAPSRPTSRLRSASFAFPPIDGEPARPGGKLSLCSYANALGLPALAVPVMRSEAGLPVGVQLIGRRGEERTLIALASTIEQALGGWLDADAP